METSKFLSKVLGFYLFIIGSAMLLNMHQFTSHVVKLINDTQLMFVSGFFVLILGLLMVVSHNVWQWSWRLIITIIAWLILFKGVSIIYFPKYLDTVTIHFVRNMSISYTAASIDVILGLVLIYKGFKD
ncbi:hypothetical protein [Legionella fallonii]|uniref:Integral membrane protein (PIN domain superfamily) n=1 Tax=Legionella fallonii LLAP-10 TaxID=1212491 RepID=A0A098G2E8_9GAMM|nr:hypothetical protein [Legionella fallonii]CEG56156.1 conserved membrane protein of unknown function [Legionella fallonii LLAP-10]